MDEKVGWVELEIGDVAEYLNGRAFKPKEWKEKGLPIIRIQNLNKEDAPYNYSDEIFEEKYLVKQGELLFAWSASLGAYIWKGKDAWLNQHIFKVIPKNFVHKLYLYYYLDKVTKELYAKAHGSGMVHVTKKKFEATSIPLPPLPEQRTIVSKIEQLFSELDNGITNLKLAQEQLKVYRQAVLKKAFEGELTREWRKQQTNLPDAKDLLEQIRVEREEGYNEKLHEWEKAVKEWEYAGKEGKRPTKPQKIKKTEPIEESELSVLTKLPKEWSWTRLGQIAWSVKDGPHYSPKYEKNGIPFISGGNIRPSGIDFSNTKYISKELHEELSKRCKPELNDILYTKGGTTGIAKVNTYDFDFNVWVHVAVLKTVKSIYPFYLQHVLNSFHCYKQSQKYTHGVGNQDLGLTRMILITLPICSIEEQQAIVLEIETRLSVCDKVEQDIEDNLKIAEALRQSILKKAFEGKLLNERELEEVHSASDWEPAEVLLEKIRTEKVGSGKKGKA